MDGLADPAKDCLMRFRVNLQKARVALKRAWPSRPRQGIRNTLLNGKQTSLRGSE